MTAGTGYDTASGSATSATATTGPAATNMTATHGSDTFTAENPTVNTASQSSFEAVSTFNSSLVILNVLKAEVLGAINFLAAYAKPFGGNVPSQRGGD